MNGAARRDEPPRPVAIWHQIPDGQACATPLDTAAAQLPYADLARLIARRVLGDPHAQLAVDHVLTLPPDSPLLSDGMPPLALDEEALEQAAQPVPEVADLATGAVRVMSYAGSNSPC